LKPTAQLLLLLAYVVAMPSVLQATDSPPAAAGTDQLMVSFLTAGFLNEVVARIEVERIETERLTGAYLQEETGLIWTRRDNGADLDWYAADEHCRDLEVADWTDWRMPTIEELEGLHIRRSSATYKLPSAITLTACCPWSDSRSSDSSAWNFSFRYRKRFSGSLNYSFELRALCVRNATEPDVLFYELAAEEAKEDS
jgi:hypothetical protein